MYITQLSIFCKKLFLEDRKKDAFADFDHAATSSSGAPESATRAASSAASILLNVGNVNGQRA